MGRRLGEEALKEIKDFEEMGFARSSPKLTNYIRSKKEIYAKIFRPSALLSTGRRGSSKYSSYDIFGDRHSYWYIIERKNIFIDFLVDKFMKRNPDQGKGIRSAFTQVLHLNGLHWHGCSCHWRGITDEYEYK